MVFSFLALLKYHRYFQPSFINSHIYYLNTVRYYINLYLYCACFFMYSTLLFTFPLWFCWCNLTAEPRVNPNPNDIHSLTSVFNSLALGTSQDCICGHGPALCFPRVEGVPCEHFSIIGPERPKLFTERNSLSPLTHSPPLPPIWSTPDPKHARAHSLSLSLSGEGFITQGLLKEMF